jgi:hypothetical protein
MGLLSPDQYDKLIGSASAETVSVSDTPPTAGDTAVPPVEAPKADATTPEAKADAAVAAPASTSSTDDQEDDGTLGESQGRVPYDRFKRVIDARNSAKTEAEKMRAELDRLRAELNAAKSAPSPAPAAPQPQAPQVHAKSEDEEWLDQYLGRSTPEPAANQAAPDPNAALLAEINDLKKWRQNQEVSRQREILTRQIGEAKAAHPDVDGKEMAAYITQSIIRSAASGTKPSVKKLAEDYATWARAKEEAIIERHLAARQTEGQSAPPRPHARGATAPTKSAGNRPKTFREASEALLKALGSN